MESRGPNDRGRLKIWWSNVMHSAHKKMALGAQYITRLMSKPHGDGWRRGNGKK